MGKIMLENNSPSVRLKRGNTLKKIDKYIIRNLILDLHNPVVKIEVELYINNLLVDTKYIYYEETTGDVDVNSLIDKTHEYLKNADI
jgi:hypothetical protein